MKKVLRVVGAVGLAFMAVCVLHGQVAPTIMSVSPASAYNYASTTITISGTGFQSGAIVTLGTNALTLA
jgi:hypothetical protein